MMVSFYVSTVMLLLFMHVSIVIGADFFNTFGGNQNGNPFRGNGRQQHRASTNGDDDNNGYYKLVGVDRQASTEDIKKSYRKLAMRTHPDKGGDAEEFKQLQEAYEVLIDPDKRTLYDKYGINGVKTGGGGRGGFPNDFNNNNPFGGMGGFEDLFRGFGGAFAVPLVFQLDVSLEDLYNGNELTIPINEAKIKITIQPGMYGGQELILRGKIVDARDQPRDLIFRLREMQHPVYTRKNGDLLTEMSITLKEALLGFEYSFKHLDDTTIYVKSKPNDIYDPETVFMIPDLGMPLYQNPKLRGRLFIKVKIEFPKKIWLHGDDLDHFERLLTIDLSSRSSSKLFASNSSSADSTGTSNIGMMKKKIKKVKSHPSAIMLAVSDIKNFGKFGISNENEDPNESPFTHYFFR